MLLLLWRVQDGQQAKAARPHGTTCLDVLPQGQLPAASRQPTNRRFGTPVVCYCLLVGPSCLSMSAAAFRPTVPNSPDEGVPACSM